MSYHGLGQLSFQQSFQQIPTVNTAQPTQPTQQISSPLPSDYMIMLPSDQPVMPPPPEPVAPIYTAAKALPSNYSETAAGCKGKAAIPIHQGRPGYPGFLCVDLPTAQAAQVTTFQNIATGGTGSSGGSGMVSAAGIKTKTAAGGMNVAVPSKSELAPGSPATDTQQPKGTVTQESFVAACKQLEGTMGTPNCCKLSSGVNLGVQGGVLVQVTQCSVAAAGLGGSLPLIAGAAVVALLLARGM